MEQIKVEIGNYREVNKGALKAFFTLVIYPTGQTIRDCRYFLKDDGRWFSLPQKEIKKPDGQKSEYIPLITFQNKEYSDALKNAVIEALKTAKPQETYGQANTKSHEQTDFLSGNSSTVCF